jgi:hypothetical protein
MIPPGKTSPRELIHDVEDHNLITQVTQYMMFAMLAQGTNDPTQFTDGTNTYNIHDANGTLVFPNLFSGLYLLGTTVTEPSGAVSAITFPSDTYVYNNYGGVSSVAAGMTLSMSSWSPSFGVTSGEVVATLDNSSSSSSVTIAQLGLLPSYYDTSTEIILWGLDSSTSQYVGQTYTTIPTVATAIYTIFTLSTAYVVPASGAVSITYGITATL